MILVNTSTGVTTSNSNRRHELRTLKDYSLCREKEEELCASWTHEDFGNIGALLRLFLTRRTLLQHRYGATRRQWEVGAKRYLGHDDTFNDLSGSRCLGPHTDGVQTNKAELSKTIPRQVTSKVPL